MTRNYGRIKTTIWGDDDFRDLTDGAQALYLRLLSSPTMNLCGVCAWRPSLLARLTKGMTPAKVRANAQELVEGRYIILDDEWEEVLVRTFVKHESVIHNPKTAAGAESAFKAIMSTSLRVVISREMARLRDAEPELKGWPFVPDSLSFACEIGDRLPIPSGIDRVSDPVPIHQSLLPEPKTRTLEPDRFEEFWSAYPKRKDRGHAVTAYKKALKKTDADSLFEAVCLFAIRSENADPQFIPLASTWLNGERWADEESAESEVPEWMR